MHVRSPLLPIIDMNQTSSYVSRQMLNGWVLLLLLLNIAGRCGPRTNQIDETDDSNYEDHRDFLPVVKCAFVDSEWHHSIVRVDSTRNAH